MITAGKRIRRKRGKEKIDCSQCPKRFAWIPENRDAFRRWRLWLMGVGGDLCECDQWNWIRLDDAWQRIDRFMASEYGAAQIQKAFQTATRKKGKA